MPFLPPAMRSQALEIPQLFGGAGAIPESLKRFEIFQRPGLGLRSRQAMVGHVDRGCCPCPGQQGQSPPALGQPSQPQAPFEPQPQTALDLCDEMLKKVGLSLDFLCHCMQQCRGGGRRGTGKRRLSDAALNAIYERDMRGEPLTAPERRALYSRGITPSNPRTKRKGERVRTPFERFYGARATRKRRRKSIPTFMGPAVPVRAATTTYAGGAEARLQQLLALAQNPVFAGDRKLQREIKRAEVQAYGSRSKRRFPTSRATIRARQRQGLLPYYKQKPGPRSVGAPGSLGYRVLSNGACLDIASRRFVPRATCYR
jgi:hypothetical protein